MRSTVSRTPSTRRATRLRATPLLRAVIEDLGVIQGHLALTLDITPTHLNHILAGRRTLSEPQAHRLATVIGEGESRFLLFELAVDRRLASPRSNGHGDEA
jgi:plasmid maintenance system antidote protein VapI